MKYLLDTDICIYWLKGKSTVRTKIEQVDLSDIAICVITVTELYFGAYNSNKIEQNLKTAENFIQSIAVLPLSNDTLKKFGQLKAQLRQAGTPVADFDLLIASVAIATLNFRRSSFFLILTFLSPKCYDFCKRSNN